MVRLRGEIALGLTLLALYAAFWLFETQGVLRGRLTPAETDAYLAAIDRNLPDDVEGKAELLDGVRAFCREDDGGPVFMLNLMRYYDALRRVPGLDGFEGTPQQANAVYEEAVTPLVVAAGGYPLFTGAVQGLNLLSHEPGLDAWSRVVVVRYPSRRQFLGLLADPAYGPLEPYKVAALKVVLMPVHGQIVAPEPRVAVAAGFLVVFLAAAWLRACRRVRT